MKAEKRETTKGIKLFNQEKKIRTIEEKENYKYMGIWEADTIKQTEIKKKKKRKGYRRKTNLKSNSSPKI